MLMSLQTIQADEDDDDVRPGFNATSPPYQNNNL